MKTNIKSILVVSVLGLFAFLGCKEEPKETAMVEKIPGINLDNMDDTVSPKDDFYNYVNGNWAKTTTIPEDETRWGGFGVLRKTTRKDVLDIVNTSKELGTYAEGTDQKKALLIFESELDTVARNEAGIKPIKSILAKIDGIKNLEEMQTIQGHYRDETTRSLREAAGISPDAPTDVELECLAQTWSEHCKHKIFASKIHHIDTETGEDSIIDSIFKTHIPSSKSTGIFC